MLEWELASLPSILSTSGAVVGGGQRAYLARVKVNQVQRVARELDALALDDVRVLAAYSQVISLHSNSHTQSSPSPIPSASAVRFNPPPSLSQADSTSLPSPTAGYSGAKRTSNLPDQVIGDNGRVVCGRHGWRYFRIWRIGFKDSRLQASKEDFSVPLSPNINIEFTVCVPSQSVKHNPASPLQARFSTIISLYRPLMTNSSHHVPRLRDTWVTISIRIEACRIVS